MLADQPIFLQALRCSVLRTAYRFSCEQINVLTGELAHHAAALDGIETIAVSGSLGRLEANSESDIDCIIVLRDEVSVFEGQAQTARVHEVFSRSPLKAPKRDGIYRQAIARAALLDRTALGSLGESPDVFGKRMALLLDARPLFGSERFHRLQGEVIEWYGADFLASSPARGWTYLTNDLMRYLHSYALWQQFKFARSSDDSWQLRQAKFRTSRIVTFAALMFLVGESDRDSDKLRWLHAQLSLTPLQRLHKVMGVYDPHAYAQLLSVYEAAVEGLTENGVRAQLINTGPDADTRLTAPPGAAYAHIKRVSAAVSRLLVEFAMARREDWGMRFFERWLL